MDEALAARRREAERTCTRSLLGHPLRSAQERLREIAEAAELDDLDVYGEHGEVAALETEVAELLGTPAAVFLPSGVMAQQAALRAWAERTGHRAVAVHGLSHLVVHELGALEELHGLRLQHLADARRPATVADLDALPEPLGAVTVELPLRDAGYLLPTWEELVAFSQACRARGVPLHLDGARLWESQPYLGHPLAEIAALADSVYVSFYKGLGGLAGAAVAGPRDLVAEVRRWQRRHGGTLYTLLPYAVAARDGLRRYLPRMGDYHRRAVDLAAALASVDGLRVLPDPPHTNAFRLFAAAPAAALEEATVACMEREGVATVRGWREAQVPGWSLTEITVGEASMGWEVDEMAAVLARLLQDARDGAGATGVSS